MAFDFLAAIDALTPRNLTVREQVRLAENPLDLRWQAIAPRVEAPSIIINEITAVAERFVGGRREWNAQGREIPEVIGPRRVLEMIPINPTRHMDERRLQLLRERARGIESLFQADIVKTIDGWATALADACYRQVERDFFEAWATNAITVMDTKSGATTTVPLGIDSARYVDDSTPGWDDAGGNAYDSLLTHIGAAVSLMGSVGVIRMRRATATEVVADAPAGANAVRPTIGNVSERISEEGWGPINIVIDERTYFEHTDGGSAYTSVNYVPTGLVLFQPADGRVGSTHVAPVTRAYDFLSSAEIKNGVANDVTVYLSELNFGKTLLEEAQMNALSLPEEQFTYVVDAGV